MSDAAYVSAGQPFRWSRAIMAGLLATIVITISLALFGTNIMKSLGSMMLPNASVGVQYLAGGAFHLIVGLFYGVVYALLFGKVREWNPFLKGAVFGLAITAIAMAAMPVMASMMPGGAAGNPCAAAAANPCNPCASKAANPCNPCAAKSAANPCNPCSALGGAQNKYGGAMSAINHLLFALTLAFVYRARPAI
jgi:hypothetical protein